MKQKLVIAAVIAVFALTGCSTAATSPTEAAPAETSEEVPAAPLDLVGEWKQTNSNDENTYQAATITADTISIDWVNDAESSKSIYWAGTYTAPTEPTESFTWDSTNDKSITDTAMMASGDDTKTFTYESGVLSYELTALGTTMTVEMERQ